MTENDAKSYVRQTLRGAFARRFGRGTQLTDRCSRISATRLACSTNWSLGPNHYYGSVTVFYEIYKLHQVWTDHYTIHWVNDRCYFHSRHPHRCMVYGKRGTY